MRSNLRLEGHFGIHLSLNIISSISATRRRLLSDDSAIASVVCWSQGQLLCEDASRGPGWILRVHQFTRLHTLRTSYKHGPRNSRRSYECSILGILLMFSVNLECVKGAWLQIVVLGGDPKSYIGSGAALLLALKKPSRVARGFSPNRWNLHRLDHRPIRPANFHQLAFNTEPSRVSS